MLGPLIHHVNGKVVTVDAAVHVAEAIAVKGDKHPRGGGEQ